MYYFLSRKTNLQRDFKCANLLGMFPILFSIGKIPVSSFGLFLALAFLLATFLVWRLARAWDLNEEKILDLVLLTFFGSLIGARIFFVSLNFDYFAPSLSRILLITSYPGLSFWGGLLGGWLTLLFFTKRFKLDFLQIADLAAIGLLGGLILGDVGCFLGGCGIGMPSNFLGVNMVGAVGKRFPIQLFEAVIFLVILLKLWPKSLRFHFPGKILSIGLISIGLTKSITDLLRVSSFDSHILAFSTLILGIFIYFKASKKSFKKTLHELKTISVRELTALRDDRVTLEDMKRSWYNGRSKLRLALRRLGVKPTPKNF